MPGLSSHVGECHPVLSWLCSGHDLLVGLQQVQQDLQLRLYAA